MSLDGAVLHNVKKEILAELENGRLDKIAQPSRHELIVHFRTRGGNKKLLLSASSSTPRVHFTEFVPENPQNPPMFCMLLRKHLSGARLVDIRQNGMDRVLSFDFEGYNEFGDQTIFSLVCEIMGRHSNIILLNQSSEIIDSIKRVDFNTSSVRQILPGMMYRDPPAQDKHNILELSTEDFLKIINEKEHKSVSKAIMESLEGFSPLPAREIAYRATEEDKVISTLSTEEQEKLEAEIEKTKDILNGEGTPTMVIKDDGRPFDFSFMPIEQYGSLMETKSYDSYSEMLDVFYVRRDTMERMSQKNEDLKKLMHNTLQRVIRRTQAQEEELKECKDRDSLRLTGDLLTANLHNIKKGDSSVVVENFYDEAGGTLEISLDIRKTPAQNAQHYYGQYRKLATAEEKLTQLIKAGKEEINYLESAFDSLERAETEGDLEEIRSELADTGYVRKKTGKKASKEPKKQPPHTFVSSDGFTIYAGRNNRQNEKLTLKDSKPTDIWLHTQKIPGSHVIIVTENKQVPETTLLEAAAIAAYHSKGQNSSNVPVDYTLSRHVKKIPAGKPGMVTYDNFKTITADPDQELVDALIKKD